MAHVFARMGNRPAAEKIREEMLGSAKIKYVSPYDIAVIHAGLGEQDRAFEWLNKAFDEHSALMVYMSSDPRSSLSGTKRPFRICCDAWVCKTGAHSQAADGTRCS